MQCKKFLLIFLIILLNFLGIFSSDEFCAELKIFKKKWLKENAVTISALNATDLKQCLNFCCNILGKFLLSIKFFKI